jgi:hypothetical protein
VPAAKAMAVLRIKVLNIVLSVSAGIVGRPFMELF